MGAGLPAVGTAVSGIEDVIEHDRSGLLVPPADAGRLADAMLRLASDRPLRGRLAKGAIDRVARFAPDLVSKEYRQVTLQVLASYRDARHHANRPAEHPQSP
jgi:glycosyltransferase involved in cell wall biosynthesis